MYKPIPLSVPSISGNEWKYVKKCLDTEWVSSTGEYVDLFEKKIAEYTGANHAVACVNGTSALHTALILAGVRPDDEVIVPTLTFVAPVNVVRYCGAFPIFMDSDDYYNIDSTKAIEFIVHETELKVDHVDARDLHCEATKPASFNKKTGRRVSAVVPVHVFGNAAYLDELKAVCDERNIKIVEDATESLGTRYIDGKFAAKCAGTIGQIGCLSFNGNKIVTTGGGGMVLTDSKELADRARYLTTQAKDDAIRYIHGEIGYNYRLTSLQAAIGVAQLERLPEYLVTKRRNYSLYKSKVDRIMGLRLAPVPEYAQNNHWMYALQIDQKVYGRNREELMAILSDRKIQTRPVWHLNHLQVPFKNSQSYRIEKAIELQENTLNIPCSVNLQVEDIDRVVSALRND